MLWASPQTLALVSVFYFFSDQHLLWDADLIYYITGMKGIGKKKHGLSFCMPCFLPPKFSVWKGSDSSFGAVPFSSFWFSLLSRGHDVFVTGRLHLLLVLLHIIPR